MVNRKIRRKEISSSVNRLSTDEEEVTEAVEAVEVVAKPTEETAE